MLLVSKVAIISIKKHTFILFYNNLSKYLGRNEGLSFLLNAIPLEPKLIITKEFIKEAINKKVLSLSKK